jgi:hypothetical protein
VLSEDLLDLTDRRRRLVAGADEKAQAQSVVRGVTIKREARGIRAAVLTAVEHVDQRLAGGLVPALGKRLVEDSCDPAHGNTPLPPPRPKLREPGG